MSKQLDDLQLTFQGLVSEKALLEQKIAEWNKSDKDSMDPSKHPFKEHNKLEPTLMPVSGSPLPLRDASLVNAKHQSSEDRQQSRLVAMAAEELALHRESLMRQLHLLRKINDKIMQESIIGGTPAGSESIPSCNSSLYGSNLMPASYRLERQCAAVSRLFQSQENLMND